MGPGLGDVVLKALNEHKRTQSHPSPTGDVTPPVQVETPLSISRESSLVSLSTSPPRRPKHRTQASFDWFDARPADPEPLHPHFEHGEDAGDHDHSSHHRRDDHHDFKGAFTDEDLSRGSTLVRELSIDPHAEDEAPASIRTRSKSRERRPPRVRATSVPKRASESMLKDKGKERAGGSGSEWEDELRDAFTINGNRTPRAPKPESSRRLGLWHGGLRGHPKGESGTSTPDGSGTEGTLKRPRPPPRRATTAGGGGGGGGWTAIRNRMKSSAAPKPKDPSKTLTGHELITELTTGVLPMVLLKMGMDRDEHGDPRIPILMNYLKLRITDSVYPFHDRHAVFRIELEYGDGLVKWVIYRELKDFINLHAHYRVANLRQGIDKFPTFPKTSLPYMNWLKSEGKGSVGRAEFSKGQREVLEAYLLKLIRATMFGPGANRLCKFLEISAMSVSLAPGGGEQGKQGYLRIMSSGASRRKEQGFHPFSWTNRHEPKWFVVRDSYIVAVDDPASTKIYEVFMIDSSFELERPKRIYRQGLNLFSHPNDSDSSLSPASTKPPDPLLANEPSPAGRRGAGDPLDPSTSNATSEDALKDSSNHTFFLKSSERKLRLVAKTERQQDQFVASIEKMVARTIWAGKNRFESFAPIRLNASAQWLIDGRDYFWSLSRAIMLAKEKIYIHDWWLSPELYLRRPPAENSKWRLDKLLQRKARQGVQIFVIVYKEVSNDFTPVDSNYTKTRLRALHPNIHVQRSPSHTSTGTLLWSHHEKMCVIDETIGFMGGLDLCFGRWDTPGHVLVDEWPSLDEEDKAQNDGSFERESSQIWPGKDYANSRVVDFHTLSKPDEDMYDRGKVPRQPWHDIGLQIIGQPARDLCRHFIQRWNYLLRTKNHSIEMPFLLPAPDFTAHQLQQKRITGTCEVQICRSVGPWSMGISHIEHSIQNAYIKAIQLSDHFVYIENQFFITSTEVSGTVIENKIGDALVSRILAAHSEGTPWRAVVIIPLVPGYPFPIDHSDAGSVRNIMECQNYSICRGEHSIFARLRREGIDPDEYITFFSLRGWGKLSSGVLTTEAVYIHAKAMVVDDRTVIIGSANINERSQRGDRDSELACIIRDTDMMDSTMAGKPYKVGRFAHTMRVRLMREHLGVDVDELEVQEANMDLLDRRTKKKQEPEDAWDPDHEQEIGQTSPQVQGHTLGWAARAGKALATNTKSVLTGANESAALGLQKAGGKVYSAAKVGEDEAEGATKAKVGEDEESYATRLEEGQEPGEGFASTIVPTMEEKVMAEHRPHDGNEAPKGVKDGKTKDETEKEDGPSVNSPHDNEGHDASEHVAKTAEQDDLTQSTGSKTTQSGGLDDTRKLPLEGDAGYEHDGEVTKPLAPITETPERGPSKIKDSAPPPDVAKANGTHSPDNLAVPSEHNGSSSTLGGGGSHSPSHHSPLGSPALDSDRAKANETAANRNTANASAKRNLREKPNAYNIPVPAPAVDPHGFADPLTDKFYKDVWMTAAVRNTQAFRKVFRCVPDDLVSTWKQYREFGAWAERHTKPPKNDDGPDLAHHPSHLSANGGSTGQGVNGDTPTIESMHKNTTRGSRAPSVSAGDRRAASGATAAGGEGHDHDEGFPQWERDQMEECLNEVRGHLVIYPTRFLEAESAGGNFLFSKDRLPPLAIYD